MTEKIDPPDLTYSQIKEEVNTFCEAYKKDHVLPAFPTNEELVPYQEIIDTSFQPLVADIKQHFNDVGADANNALDHALWVALRAGFITNDECQTRGLDSNKTQSLVRKSLLAGLLHDIERHVGIEDHMEKGAEVARELLEKYDLFDEDITEAIRYHDYPEYTPEGNEEYKILYGALFDADHLRWGTERENDFWDMKERKGMKPEEVIHDYQWLYPLRNAWKTEYGKRVCKEYVEYAIAIAEHIEKIYSER